MSDLPRPRTGYKFSLTPEQALLVLPILGGFVVSLVVFICGLYPLIAMLQKQEDKVKLYQDQSDQISLLQRRLLSSEDQYQLLEAQQLKLISLATSDYGLDTILAVINQMASEKGIQILSVVPEKLIVSEKSSKPKNKTKELKSSGNVSTLTENELFQSQAYQFEFSGSYVALQQFLVDLESLQTAVLVSDLGVSAPSSSKSAANINSSSSTGNLLLKMRVVALRRTQEGAAEGMPRRSQRYDFDLP